MTNTSNLKLSKGALSVYNSIMRGQYNRAAVEWFNSKNNSFAPRNQSILLARINKMNKEKLRRNPTSVLISTLFKTAQNRRSKNMSKYYNTRLASKLLNIESRIKSNRLKLGGIQKNTQKRLYNLYKEKNTTREKLFKKLESNISFVGPWRTIVPVSVIIGSNYNNTKYRSNQSGGQQQRTKTRGYTW